MQDEKRIAKLTAHGISHPMAELILFRFGKLTTNQLIWVIEQCHCAKSFQWDVVEDYAQQVVDQEIAS